VALSSIFDESLFQAGKVKNEYSDERIKKVAQNSAKVLKRHPKFSLFEKYSEHIGLKEKIEEPDSNLISEEEAKPQEN
jgi:hypothetical protein